MEFPAAFAIAGRVTAHTARSALPNSPVVPDGPRRTRRPSDPEHSSWLRLRAGIATTLHVAARTVAPPERPQTHSQGPLGARG